MFAAGNRCSLNDGTIRDTADSRYIWACKLALLYKLEPLQRASFKKITLKVSPLVFDVDWNLWYSKSLLNNLNLLSVSDTILLNAECFLPNSVVSSLLSALIHGVMRLVIAILRATLPTNPTKQSRLWWLVSISPVTGMCCWNWG